jgi:hypothetical protein
MVVGRWRAACTSGISMTERRVGVPPTPFRISNWVFCEVDQMAKR